MNTNLYFKLSPGNKTKIPKKDFLHKFIINEETVFLTYCQSNEIHGYGQKVWFTNKRILTHEYKNEYSNAVYSSLSYSNVLHFHIETIVNGPSILKIKGRECQYDITFNHNIDIEEIFILLSECTV